MDRARRCRARYRDPHRCRPRAGRGTTGAGATAVRRGAGDARRAEGADHPRLLHARCCTSSRSRPTSPLASTCSTRPRNRSCSTDISLGVLLDAAQQPDGALGRALAGRDRPRSPTAPSRRWSAKRSASATPSRSGSVTAAASRRPSRAFARRSASPADDTIEQVEKEMVGRAASALVRMGGRRRGAGARLEERSRAGATIAGSCSPPPASERAGNYLRFFLTGTFEPRATPDHQGVRELPSRRSLQRLDAERPRMLRADRAPQGHRLPRPHRGARSPSPMP